MSDPILDEDLIEHLLSCPVTVETLDAVQAGAAQALIALYDRKVLRDVFITEAGACIALYGHCSKFRTLNSICDAFRTNDLTDEHFVVAHTKLTELITAQAKTVHEIIGRLKECPTSRDPIH